MLKVKDGFRVCCNCHKLVNLKLDKYVLLGTYNVNNSLKADETFFHFNCWVDYFNKCVLEKARKNVQGLQFQALKVLENPMIKGMISNMAGGEQLMGMLNTNLDSKEKDVNFIKKIEKKIEDDRRKKTGTKKRSKVKMQ